MKIRYILLLILIIFNINAKEFENIFLKGDWTKQEIYSFHYK